MLAITTRNRLSSRRFFLPMLRAWTRVRSQVAEILTPYIDTYGRPDKRDLNPEACGVQAILLRLGSGSPAALRRLHQHVRSWSSAPGLLRHAVCLGWGECLLITLWKAQASERARDFLAEIVPHVPGPVWTMRCKAGDYEIGNWNGLCLRNLARQESARRRSSSKQLASADKLH